MKQVFQDSESPVVILFAGGDTALSTFNFNLRSPENRMEDIAMEPQRSYLSWMFSAMGPFYGLLIPFVGFILFIGACLVVGANRRPAVIAAFLVFLPLPMMIGLFGSLQGFIASLLIMASAGTAPKPSELAEGVSMGLFTTLVGLLVTFPGYLVLAFGLFFRTLAHKTSEHQ